MTAYRSTTLFDKSLELFIIEQNDGRKTYNTYSGFRSLEEAKLFREWWLDLWEFGYSGWAADPIVRDGVIAIDTERCNSCD